MLNDSELSAWRRALAFDDVVPSNGYRWWYLDALSDDGRSGLTIIFFIGSVFSPYYAARRRRGPASPDQHVAVNVGLYEQGSRRWAMTERDRNSLSRNQDRLCIGPSRLAIHDDGIEIVFDEVTAPIPSAIRGRLVVRCAHPDGRWHALGGAARHHWQPIAPCARIEVDLEQPAKRWIGAAYVDGNRGSEPLEDAFQSWQWSRATDSRGRTVVFYDYVERDERPGGLALVLSPDGRAEHAENPPALGDLPTTLWRIRRGARSANSGGPKILRTLEDGPFYARSLVGINALGEDLTAVHESLSLVRFRQRWVQMLLPVRTPRRTA